MPFKSSPMFSSKAGAYLSEAPLRWSTLGLATGILFKALYFRRSSEMGLKS
jgi:hypothetical protein